MKKIILNNGIEMPIAGFGVFQISDYEECVRCVLNAIDVGYRLIDTAQGYGNEEAVGEAIKLCGLQREELFITTKVWISNAGYEKTKKTVLESLEKMQLDYIDLYLIHQPLNDYYGSYRALEELYKSGKIKAIGVSNFYPDRLVDLTLFNEVKPALNQIEINPFNQQIEALKTMKKYNIQPEAWAPFAEGRNEMFNNEILKKIGLKYSKSVAQVILRWLVQKDIVVLSKTTSIERMKENINIFDFELSNEDLELISTMDKKVSSFFSHHDPDMIEYLASLKR